MNKLVSDRAIVIYDTVICLPRVIVWLVDGYDQRVHHSFLPSPNAVLSEEDRKFELKSDVGTAVRGKHCFAEAALRWSMRVSHNTSAWIGLVRNDAKLRQAYCQTYSEGSSDFAAKDCLYVQTAARGAAAIYSGVANGTSLCVHWFMTAPPVHRTCTEPTTLEAQSKFDAFNRASSGDGVDTVWTFEVDLDQKWVRAARNGIWIDQPIFVNISNLDQMTVFATLDRGSSGFVRVEVENSNA